MTKPSYKDIAQHLVQVFLREKPDLRSWVERNYPQLLPKASRRGRYIYLKVNRYVVQVKGKTYGRFENLWEAQACRDKIVRELGL